MRQKGQVGTLRPQPPHQHPQDRRLHQLRLPLRQALLNPLLKAVLKALLKTLPKAVLTALLNSLLNDLLVERALSHHVGLDQRLQHQKGDGFRLCQEI